MDARVENLTVSAYRVPTDGPEADGTLSWDSTMLVLVECKGGGETGIGWTYTNVGVATLVTSELKSVVEGVDALSVEGAHVRMARAIRNLGRPGLAATAIAAVDVALWDLKAKLLGLPLARLLGQVHERVLVYGSGGFTNYSDRQLRDQLGGWAADRFRFVKMKVGSEPDQDVRRVRIARNAIGEAQLFVDANGAYTRKQALAFAEAVVDQGVTWLEEPVSSDDLEGLRLLRDRAPAPIQIAAGEYGYDLVYFRRMLEAGAVDVLQADATRCMGITGFMKASVLCEAYGIPLSAHTAPTIHLHAACASAPFVHLEYFHDHVRIERMLFDGFQSPVEGALAPDLSRSGLGVAFRHADARRYAL